MSLTPLFKKLKSNGTSFYAFPGAAEDISASYQNDNYRMYFSKYVLLNLPKEQVNAGGTNSNNTYFNFGTFSTVSPALATTYGDRVIESLRNYVANHEVSLRESRLNNTEYYYDTRSLETTTEKIFWKWCKKIGIFSLEPAVPSDEYFQNLEEFQRINLNDDTYFPEYLWKEREVTNYDITDYFASGTPFLNKLELVSSQITNIRQGDVIELVDFNTGGNLPQEIFSSATWSTISLTVLDVTVVTSQHRIVVDYNTSVSSNLNNTGQIRLKYNRLVQYIGEVNGISNVQEANRAYTEVYAHIPDHTGQTPDVLFRTLPDNNYKPGLVFPIIPSQYQPEIIGAELFSSPIVSNPANYPGGYYGQFDTIDFTYECEGGDTLRRSGRFYGVSGDINNPIVDGSSLDGLTIDFNTSHYVKMNITDREVSTFDEFNALEINNTPPTDFEFNAILWYYTVEDLNGNRRTNLYGISFLDNPDNNVNPQEVSIRFPVYKKFVTNGNQDGTSYAFGLNLNFNIIHDNPQEAYNPQAINSLFSMNLFNEAMRRLAFLNETFTNVLGEQTDLKTELSNIKQLLYTQTDLNTINARINNLDELLKLYSTMQITSSETIEVQLLPGSPGRISLNSIDAQYSDIYTVMTSQMYDINGSIPFSVTPPNNKKFLIEIKNNDDVSVLLPNSEKLSIVINDDLSYKQSMDIIVKGVDISTQNKKLDVFINTINLLPGTSSVVVTPPIQTLLIGDIDLPVLFNSTNNVPNSAATWKSFNLDIDFSANIQVNSGNFLQLTLDQNSLIVANSVKVGDTLVLNNLFIGTVSTFDFSGQYEVENVVGNVITLDLNSNTQFVSYLSNQSFPFVIHGVSSTILMNTPYFSLNKGYQITITRIGEEDDISISEKYLIDIRDLQY
jgi:hypothetical protein